MKALTAFIKPVEAPQRSVKEKIQLTFIWIKLGKNYVIPNLPVTSSYIVKSS